MLSDRDAIALLVEIGIGPGSSAGLIWRLREVDGLDPERIAAETGIQPASVRVYLWRVNRRLREGHRHYLRAEDAAEPDEPAEVEDDDHDPVTEQARALLAAVANRETPHGAAGEAIRSPAVSVQDAKRIIQGEPVRFLALLGPPGHAGARRRRVCGC